MKILNLFLGIGVVFTIIYLGYEVVDLPILYQVNREFEGIIFDDQSDSKLVVKIEGELKKRLFSKDEFLGQVSFILEDEVTKYQLDLSEMSVLTKVGQTTWNIQTVNRKVLHGIVRDYKNRPNSVTSYSNNIAIVDITADWNKIAIYFINKDKQFVAPAFSKEEANLIKEEIDLEFWN